MRLLTHVCCGPCFTAVHESLTASGHDVAALYFNPNIQPLGEYRRRLAYLQAFCDEKSIRLDVGDYNINAYFQSVIGYPNKIDRCQGCYRLRLVRTALFAAANNYEAFTTTLLISPWQYHDKIAEVAEKISERIGVRFLYQNFRPVFRRSVTLSKAAHMYRQKYCGCLFSEAERHFDSVKRLKIETKMNHEKLSDLEIT